MEVVHIAETDKKEYLVTYLVGRNEFKEIQAEAKKQEKKLKKLKLKKGKKNGE